VSMRKLKESVALTLRALLRPGTSPDRENRPTQLLAPWLPLSASQAVLLSIASGVRSSCILGVQTGRANSRKFTRLASQRFARDQY
jgi:hypothetical protein